MSQEVIDMALAADAQAHLPIIENIQSRQDGTYVISYGGYPYHATPDQTPDVFERILAEVEGGAVVTQYVETEEPKLDPLESAVDEYNRLRGLADYVIAPLQDAIDMEEATEAERASLLAWKNYRIALSRVPKQVEYPVTIVWPDKPE